MTNTTEREQIVAWLRAQANDARADISWSRDCDDNLFLALLTCGQMMAMRRVAVAIERGDHLKESPHG